MHESVGQGWHSDSAVPIFRATPAQGLARTNLLQSTACRQDLQRIHLAARMYASDHQDRFPENWPQFTEYLDQVSLLYCPADTLHPPASGWDSVDYAAISYELVSPGVKASSDPRTICVRCRVHGNHSELDGTIVTARPYDRRFFPVAADGALVFPLPALAAAREGAASVGCVNHLKQIGLAARLFASDHQDLLPASLSEMTNEIVRPEVFFCPTAVLQAIPASVSELDFATVSYTIDSPGGTYYPVRRYASCRIHGHVLNTDGAVITGTNRYPPRLIVGQPLSQTVEPGQAVEWSVLLGDAASEGLRFQWRRQRPIDDQGEPASQSIDLEGGTNRTWRIAAATPEHEGYYDVIVYDPAGGYQVSQMAYLRVEPIANVRASPDWEALACRANLQMILLATRSYQNQTGAFPHGFAESAIYLGWPLTLCCPSDRGREPPARWDGLGPYSSSYLLSRDLPPEATTNVLATCVVHGFQVQADGAASPGPSLPPVPRLAVAGAAGADPVRVSITGVPGVECVVEAATVLANWAPVSTNLLVNGEFSLTNAVPAGGAARFYRALLR